MSAEPYYSDLEAGIVLYLGDCRSILPELGPVDHVITDPPYARDVYKRAMGQNNPLKPDARYKGVSLVKMAVGDIGHIDEILDGVASELARLVRRWALVFSDAETTHRWKAALEAGGMRYVRTGAWVKTNYMPSFSSDRPSVGFEPCTIAHAQGRMRWNGGGLAALWTYPTAGGADRPDHPCPKPSALMRRLVEQFTDPGETILDPFAGSGTTLLAAKQLGRKAIGIELSEEYCRVAVERLTVGIPAAKAMARGQAQLL